MFLLQVRYISDCKKFYGRILDNCNVVSSIEGVSGRETEEIWKRLYPDEPYSFDPDTSCWDETLEKAADTEKHTTYDLVSAIERQSPFFYQVILEVIVLSVFKVTMLDTETPHLSYNFDLRTSYVFVISFIVIELCAFFIFLGIAFT